MRLRSGSGQGRQCEEMGVQAGPQLLFPRAARPLDTLKAPNFFPFLSPAAPPTHSRAAPSLAGTWDPRRRLRPIPCLTLVPYRPLSSQQLQGRFKTEVRSCNSPAFNVPVTPHSSQEENHILLVGEPDLPGPGEAASQVPLTTDSIPASQLSSSSHRAFACPGVAQLTLLSEPRSCFPRSPGRQGPLPLPLPRGPLPPPPSPSPLSSSLPHT